MEKLIVTILGTTISFGIAGIIVYWLIIFVDFLSNKLGFGTAIFFIFFIVGFFVIITQWDSFKEEVIDKN